MSSVGRELKPTKFGIETQADATAPQPDRFGQLIDDQKDSSMGGAPSAAEIQKFHFKSDVDSSPRALHHTLGPRRNQASPGNHIHDGITSPKLGALQPGTSAQTPVPVLVLTGAKGGNVALTNLINMLKNHINFMDNTT